MDSQFILSLVTVIFIGGTAGYLGSLMITKRMALVGGPLGHLALPGAALALLYDFNLFWGALGTIIIGAVIIWLLEARTKLPMEALTGLVFAAGVAFSFLILPISQAEEALIGDISKIGLTDTILAVILGTVVFLIIKKIYSKMILSGISEDLARVEGVNVKKYNLIYLTSIALIVALEVKIVGGLLTVAMLVIPASASNNFSKTLSRYSFGALLIGIISAVLGILLFKLLGFLAGPLIILAGAFIFLISLFFKKR
jgi:ABC-type Mn2+/Zn2+ transport system permease subunit